MGARRPAIPGGVPGHDGRQESQRYGGDFIKRKIRSIVKDPVTAAILSDIDHPYAAKRPPIDTDYFETYNRPMSRWWT